MEQAKNDIALGKTDVEGRIFLFAFTLRQREGKTYIRPIRVTVRIRAILGNSK